MIPVSITLPNHLIKATAGSETGDYRCRFQGKLNTLRTLSCGHGIELGFFSWVQDHMNPDIEPEFQIVIL